MEPRRLGERLLDRTLSILTSLWARGLREFAELSEWVGNAAHAEWARGLWEGARDGFEQFWDETRGTYIDHIVDGVAQAPASQAAGATAIASGLAPRERWSRIIDAITDPATLVVRSWIGGDDGGYDMVKIEEQTRGIQRIDWDAATEVVLAEPFYSYVVHDAVAAAGRAAELPDLLRRWSVFLHDGYDTFGECWGWGTPVHGWSSTPTRDLIWYVLGRHAGRARLRPRARRPRARSPRLARRRRPDAARSHPGLGGGPRCHHRQPGRRPVRGCRGHRVRSARRPPRAHPLARPARQQRQHRGGCRPYSTPTPGILSWRSGQPLTAPLVRPATICRLKKMYMTSGGIVISRMSMNSRLYWLSV